MAHQMTISVENPSVMRTLRSLFKSIDGVTIMPQPRTKKAKKEKTAPAVAKEEKEEEEEPEMTKEEILQSIDNAFRELKLNLEGKLEFKPAEELFNEL